MARGKHVKGAPVHTPATADWTAYADALLQRAALITRVAQDRLPDPLRGIKIDDDEIDVLLRELPGLRVEEPLMDADLATDLEERAAAARDAFFAALREPSAFVDVVANAQLSGVEVEVFAVLAAVEADPRRQRLVAYLNDDATLRWLTPFTLRMLFGEEDAVVAVGPGSRLTRAALLAPGRDAPWASQRLALAPAVMWWLAGDAHLDPELPPGIEIVEAPTGGSDVLVTTAGTDRVRRLQAALLALDGDRFLVTRPPDRDEEWQAVVRQATLAGLGVVVEFDRELPPKARDHIERADHLAWAITSAVELPLEEMPRRPWRSVPVTAAPITLDEWHAVVGDEAVRQHELSATQLQLVASALTATGGDLDAAVRRLAAGHIDQLALRVRPTRGWDDIILDDDRQALLREVVARYQHRLTVFDEWGFDPRPSKGVTALFAGPSGTGKTLAAEIIAGTLGLDLYKVDLAQLVSKYIGETEKNLSKVFESAGASNVVLFFDEAEALLGKRSQVSDARDRYANIEVAYLLQRLERYDGLVVLATNLASNLDTAFLRRIHVSIQFPMPEAAERRQIWCRSIPPGAPAGDIDLDFLAEEFELSGGSIRNTALTAAFLAADNDKPMSMAHLVVALQRELQKLGRLVPGDEPNIMGEG